MFAALDRAQCHQLLGEECARLAYRLADRARMHLALADLSLTDAEQIAKIVAHKLA